MLSKVPVIAIVDDDDSFRRATMSFIRSLGYAVLQFSSAEAFLKSDQWHDADCLISDVQMPSMNGVDLQGKLIDHHFRYRFSRNESTGTRTGGRRDLLSRQTV